MRLSTLFFGLAIGFFLPAFASAQQTGDGPSAEATSLFQAGVRALQGGNPQAASEHFRASLLLHESAATACNLALSYDRWGHHESDAIVSYELCARLDSEGRFRDHAEQRAAELRSQREAPSPTPEVFVGPARPRPPEPSHLARSSDRAPVSPPLPEPSPEPRSSRPLLWAGIAGAVVAAGLGVGGAVVASGGQSDLETLRARHPGQTGTIRLAPGSDDAALLDDIEGQRSLALGLYVGAGVFGALGVALIAIDLATPNDDTQIGVAPLPGGGILQARLRFGN